MVDAHSVIATEADLKDPQFVNFPINDVPLMSYTYDAAWDFRLQASSPALSGAATGSEAFAAPYFATQGLTVNGQTYTSPTVAARFGAFGN